MSESCTVNCKTTSEIATEILVRRTSFTPIIKIDENASTDNVFSSTKTCLADEKQAINLGDSFDEDKRQYVIPIIVVNKDNPSKLTISVLEGYTENWFSDQNGIVEFICSNPKVAITPQTYLTSYADIFSISINHSLSWGDVFTIDIKSKDNPDDAFFSNNEVISGKLNCVVIKKDVFTTKEIESLEKENNSISLQVNKKPVEFPEYSGNYCMASAERMLSKLLNDIYHFYSVDENHNRLNNIGFSGKGAKDRGEYFRISDFTSSDYLFNDYKIDHSILLATKSLSDYQSNKYLAIKLSSENNKLFNYFSTGIKGSIGYHIYYMSVSDDFHTLILVINNSDPCDPMYKIYDQHGQTSSSGSLTSIQEGITKQTSWTFLNQYMNAGFNPNLYSNTVTRLWKIKRK